MLPVTAGQIGHPVALLIAMESDDRLLHVTQLRENDKTDPPRTERTINSNSSTAEGAEECNSNK
jgi:hypothetical protein